MAEISKGQKRIKSQTDMRVKYDLQEVFGVDLKGLPKVRQALGQAIIDQMIKRTKSAKDINEESFPSYSDEYKDSVDFKAFRKKKGKVDLTLTGDMLGSVTVKRDSAKEVVIGFSESLESEKAHGHVTGNVGKTRDFFGLSDNDIGAIKRKLGPELKSVLKAKGDKDRKKFETAVFSLIRKIEDGEI